MGLISAEGGQTQIMTNLDTLLRWVHLGLMLGKLETAEGSQGTQGDLTDTIIIEVIGTSKTKRRKTKLTKNSLRLAMGIQFVVNSWFE